MLATVDRRLEDERSREQQVLFAGVEFGELDVRADEVGEALLAGARAPLSATWRISRRMRSPRGAC